MNWIKVLVLAMGLLAVGQTHAATCKMERRYYCKNDLIIGGVNVIVAIWKADVSCADGRVLSQSLLRSHESRCTEADYSRLAYWNYSARYSCAELGAKPISGPPPKATLSDTYTITYSSTINFVSHSCNINLPFYYRF